MTAGFILIKGKIYGPYYFSNSIGTQVAVSVTNHNWGMVYDGTGNSGSYVQINDKVYGPYSRVGNLSVSDSHWGFTYDTGTPDKLSGWVNLDGKLYGPYDLVGSVSVADERWGFIYDKLRNGNIAGSYVVMGQMVK